MCLTPPVRTGELFDLLRDGRPWTRAQLAEATGLARSTITARIDTLMRLGLVAPFGGARSTGGRPPALFALNPTAKLVVGVDVGATHASAALTDLNGSILGEVDAQIAVADGPEAVLSWVVESVRDLLETSERARRATSPRSASACPGPSSTPPGARSTRRSCPAGTASTCLPTCRRSTPCRSSSTTTSTSWRWASAAGTCATWTTSSSSRSRPASAPASSSGGILQRGAQGTAGDLGHVRVPGADDVPCRCGNSGCLEAVAAGPALAAAVRAQGEQAETGGDVVELVRSGSRVAMGVVRQAGRDIGEVVATMVNLINPSVVVIGGQVAGAGEHLLAGIRESVYHRSLPLATEHLRIVTSRAGGEAAVLGASALAIEHVLSPDAVEAASEALAAADAAAEAAGGR